MLLNKIQGGFRDDMLGTQNAGQDLLGCFEGGGIDVESRFAIYRNNILENLHNVLSITYPTVKALVGDDFFRQAAYAFIRIHPPVSGDVTFYGEGFPNFLASLEQAASLEYLPDVAAYDWAINKAYYAADDGALTTEALQIIAPEDTPKLVLTPRKSCQLLESSYPLDEIKTYCAEGVSDQNLDIGKGGGYFLIYRPEYVVRTEFPDQAEFLMLTLLFDGQNVGNALEQTLNENPDFNFQHFLARHIALETFSKMSTNSK